MGELVKLPGRESRGDAGSNPVEVSIFSHEFLQAAQKERLALNGDKKKLLAAVEAILEGYSKGTRFGIRADTDGLLACGVPGVQLTWMDAKVGDWVVTPRIGKPVEVQALWLNALWIALGCGRSRLCAGCARWQGAVAIRAGGGSAQCAQCLL